MKYDELSPCLDVDVYRAASLWLKDLLTVVPDLAVTHQNNLDVTSWRCKEAKSVFVLFLSSDQDKLQGT